MIEQALKNLKIDNLNEMQLLAIKIIKKEADIILLSATGTGKTLAFLLPVLEMLDTELRHIQALILVPSRELALQIEMVFRQMSTGFKVNCCYGGHATRTEKNNFQHPADVLIGTPGRIAYHLRNQNFDPEKIHTLILDEFDKSLEFGFQEDMSYIIRQLPEVRKRILVSATAMPEIPAFTGIKKSVEVNFLSDRNGSSDLLLKAVKSAPAEKLETLFSLICKNGEMATLVFCNHREAVERISSLLHEKGLLHGVFHGGMEQEDRELALLKFRNGSHRLLITTDLASRGLDIPKIDVVIHYQLPHTAEAFLHRNGRTARMQAKGTAYLLISDDEHEPRFLKQPPEYEDLPAVDQLPTATAWSTLYISAGKKDKVNKVDIVGLLLQKGSLQKDELGLIEVGDFSAYAAVKRNKIDQTLAMISHERIKNKKVKIEISR
ncbi:MAG: DEAD/DEAH box helicase [Sphingobacteriaceae bacterium]